MTITAFLGAEFHDQGDNLKKKLLINSNLNHQIHHEGGREAGRGLAALMAYRYDP
jgi:hypothetical protein